MMQRRRMLASGIFRFTFTGTYTDARVNGKGTISLTSSGVLTVLSGGIAALLLRGGGGGGGHGGEIESIYGGGGGGGGGSGYETVAANVNITPGAYSISVGAGGQAGVDGGQTAAFGYTANGGKLGGDADGGQGGDGGAGKNPGQDGDQGVSGFYGRGGDGGSPNGGNGGSGEDARNPGIYWITPKNGTAGVVELTF